MSTYLQDDGWASALKPEFEQEYFKQLEVQLKKDYKAGVQVFPPKHLIFNAFNKTPIDKVNTRLKESIEYSVMCSVLKIYI